MKNKKAFTLIEVIITIAILGILAGICIPVVVKYVKQGKDNYYKSLEDELVVIAKDYYSDSRSELPRGQIDKGGNPIYINQVSLDRLRNKGYFINDVVDVNDEPCTGYVRVENNKGNYVYYPCLICNDGYKTDGEYCFWDGNNNSNNTLTCEVSFKNNYRINTWSNKDVEIEVISSYKNSEDVPNIYLYKSSDGLSIKPINNIGNYKVTTTTNSLSFTTYDGVKSAVCSIPGTIKIDKVAPSCEMSYAISDDGASSVITLKASDDASEINSIILDGEEMFFSPDKTTEVWESVYEEGVYEAKVYDSANNFGSCNVNVTGLDKEAPVINLSTTIGKINATITDDFALNGYQITTSDEEPKQWITLNNIKTFTNAFDKEESGTYYVWAKDRALNVNSESIYLDMTKPIVTLEKVEKGISAQLQDDVGVMAYQITTSDDIPTRWNGISSTKLKTVLFDNLTGGTYYVWAKDANGNIGFDSMIIQSKKPTVIVTTTNTTAADDEAKVTINATINDEDDGVIGWAVTTSDALPTSWTSINNTLSYNFSVDKKDVGEYYVWAKDLSGNTDFKKVSIKLGSWGEYETTTCNEANTLLCRTDLQYKKETRTVKSSEDCYGYGCDWRCDTAALEVTGYNTVYSCSAGSLSGSRCYFSSTYVSNSACNTSCGVEFGGSCSGKVCNYSKPATASQNPVYGCPAGFSWDGSLCEKCYNHSTCYNKCIKDWNPTEVTYVKSCEEKNTSGYYENKWTTKCSEVTLYSVRSYIVVVE